MKALPLSQDLLYRSYIRDINRYPLLSRAQEHLLLLRARAGDREAVDRLVCSNLKFVINVAFVYRGQGLPLMELINEGNLGLLEAVRRFEPDRKLRFISYAVWWVRQFITRAISEKGRLVRISAETETFIRKLSRLPARMEQTMGGFWRPDARDLARRTGQSEEKVRRALEQSRWHTSLNRSPAPDEPDAMEAQVSPASAGAEISLDRKQVRDKLDRLVAKLEPKQRRVLRLYFGVGNGGQLSLSDISQQLGLSKERVRQLKDEAVENLKKLDVPRELLAAA